MMYLNELLSIPTLQELTLINQNACLDRPVATIESTETPDVISYVPKNCFIITTAMAYKENQEKLCELILSLDKLPCAGLGIKLGRFIDELDPKVIQTADSVGFPLINIPIHLTLGEVYHRFLSLLWNVENDNLVDALNTQKQLYNLIIQGVPLRQVLKLISAKLNEPCLIVDRFGELCESVNTTEDEVKAAIAHIDGLNKDDNETICCSVRLPNYVKEVKFYIYPIKSIRRNSHFMVAFSREATSPLSFFVMEEVLLNLGMLFYKQLFTDLESAKLRQSYFDMLVNCDGSALSQLAVTGSRYGLKRSVYYNIVIGGFVNAAAPLQHADSPLGNHELYIEVFNYILKNAIHYFHGNVTVFSLVDDGLYVLLVQKSALDIHAFLDKIGEASVRAFGETLKFVIGNHVKNLNDIREAYWNTLELFNNTTGTCGQSVYACQPTSILEILKTSPSYQISSICQSTLRELAEPKDDVTRELRETLSIYLDSKCSIKETADTLFLHRNTVRYRISKCQSILKHDFSDPEYCLQLQICLALTKPPA